MQGTRFTNSFYSQSNYLKRSIVEQFDYMYGLIKSELTPCGEDVVEIGSGNNNIKNYIKHVKTSDIENYSLDYQFNAEELPFEKNFWDAIVGVDVIHHLNNPLKFLSRAHEVLKQDGRIVLIEPWIRPLSYLVYKYFHHEECHFQVNLEKGITKISSDNSMGNQSVPYILFKQNPDLIKNSGFKISKLDIFSGLSFPLSGGLHYPPFIPYFFWKKIFEWEKKAPNFLKNIWAFRAIIVLQKL